jgi:hypothetical protein
MKTNTRNVAIRLEESIVEMRLEESILSLFQDLPALCGFAVRDRAGQPDGGSTVLNGGLFLTDIGLYPQPGVEVAKLICEEIRETLVALIDERPEARLLLSGRTFARALH